MLASAVVPRPHAAQRPPARRLQAGNGQRALVTTAAARRRRAAGGGKQNPTSAPSGAGGATLEEVLTLVKKIDTRQEEQGKTLSVLSQHVGVLFEKETRIRRFVGKDDPLLRSGMMVSSVDELLPKCSLAGLPADKEGLLRGLVSLHSAVEWAFMAVALLMQAEATARDVVLPAHPGHMPADAALWLRQARALLLRARHEGKAKGKPAWLDACDDLAAYAEAAAESSQLAFRALEKQGGLALLLLGAAATGEMVQVLEMDGEPVLRFTKAGLELDLLEIKPSADAIRDAVRQLQRQANVLLLALALSNAAALQGPLHVVATVEVAAEVPKPPVVKYWESRQLSVGGVGPAPKVPMHLRIRH